LPAWPLAINRTVVTEKPVSRAISATVFGTFGPCNAAFEKPMSSIL
jgi:hypothetical protein